MAAQSGAIARRLAILQIQHGAAASDSIGMPVAAWLLGECLLHWAVRWRASEVGTPFYAPALVAELVHGVMLKVLRIGSLPSSPCP